MECHDVQQLLAFVDRKSEELDETEREAVKQHLDRCSVCAESALAERRLNEAVGAILRDVPVPVGLKQKVLDRLTTERGGAPWKSLLAAGAILGILVIGGLAWYGQTHPTVEPADLVSASIAGNMDAADVEREFAKRGVRVTIPREMLDFQYFQDASVADFKGQRVARLNFQRLEEGRVTTASVLVLSPAQFRMTGLKDGLTISHPTSIRVHHEADFVNVIYFRGDLHRLRQAPVN